jgi:hypothetical protein
MIQEFRSRSVEVSRRIAATERVRDLLASGSVPDVVAPEVTGLGDECALTEWAESFAGDEGWGDFVSEDMVAARVCAFTLRQFYVPDASWSRDFHQRSHANLGQRESIEQFYVYTIHVQLPRPR